MRPSSSASPVNGAICCSFPIRRLPSVELAEDGEEAVERREGELFDLVLTDLALGAGLDGMAVLERARALQPHAAVVKPPLVSGCGCKPRLRARSWSAFRRQRMGMTQMALTMVVFRSRRGFLGLDGLDGGVALSAAWAWCEQNR